MNVDYDFSDHGFCTMVHCRNKAALDHLATHTGDDAMWSGMALAVEPRYAPDLSAELCRDGFTVELPNGRVVTAADLAEA